MLQYAVEVLEVKHVIVCGHYGCGGVKAALERARQGLIDNWLRHVQDVAQHADLLAAPPPTTSRPDLLCGLNALEQANNVCGTTVVQDAWARGQRSRCTRGLPPEDGVLSDLGATTSGADEVDVRRAETVARLAEELA